MAVVYFTHNPIDADEFVLVTSNVDRAEEAVYVRCTPYRVDKVVYPVEPTDEIERLFASPEEFERARNNLGALKQFSLRNCGVPRIDKIVRVVATRAEAT